MKAVLRHVSAGRANDALLLPDADGVLRWIGILSGFDFHKYKNVAIPGYNVDFPALHAISGSNDAIAKRAQIIDGLNFRAPTERQQAMEQ